MNLLKIGLAGLAVGAAILQTALLGQHFYGSDEDLAGWVGAVGTVFALVGGFATVAYAERERRKGLSQAAAQIVCEALNLVTERLDVALQPKQPGRRLELRELRTTEMIAALRAISPADLPSSTVTLFAHARAGIHAVNGRISELYSKEDDAGGMEKQILIDGRYNELESAVTVLGKTRERVERLIALPVIPDRGFPLIAIPDAIAEYSKTPTPKLQRPRPRRSPKTATP